MNGRRIYLDELIEILGKPADEILGSYRMWHLDTVALICRIDYGGFITGNLTWKIGRTTWGTTSSMLQFGSAASFQEAFEKCSPDLQERLIFHLDVFNNYESFRTS